MAGQLTALLAPNRTSAKTKRLDLTHLASRGRFAGLMAGGHLAVASFEQNPSKISFTASRKVLSSIPIFEGSTRIGKTRVNYRRDLEAGQAMLQKNLMTVSTEAELDIVAADGSICIRNRQGKQARVIAGGKVIRIRANSTSWIG